MDRTVLRFARSTDRDDVSGCRDTSTEESAGLRAYESG